MFGEVRNELQTDMLKLFQFLTYLGTLYCPLEKLGKQCLKVGQSQLQSSLTSTLLVSKLQVRIVLFALAIQDFTVFYVRIKILNKLKSTLLVKFLLNP